ncbi:MAG: putative integral rane protein [Edaphobacter sp.]|nr:putative integral rane protein [Edaphobacter sp.]
MQLLTKWGKAVRSLHWTRGLRAGVAVAAAMAVCHMLGKPMGWAALGGFETILVDNGGPYRSRLTTMATVLLGGAVACVVGSVVPDTLWVAVVVTAAFCFAVTFARVVSQPVASTSVIVLVIYFAGLGGSTHTLIGALGNATAFLLAGAWAAALSLVLWPVDPFRPARLAVAECYALLAEFIAGVQIALPHGELREAQRSRMHGLQRAMRLQMEAARNAIGTTGARATARTVRARSLTVLLETADMLFAETIRWTELAEVAADEASRRALADAVRWLSGSERAVADGLRQRPRDGGASFAPEGSHSLEHVRGRGRPAVLDRREIPAGSLLAHLAAEERDALQNVEVAFESVRAVWSGVEFRAAADRWTVLASRNDRPTAKAGWADALRANWTRESVMMRHALRIGVVGGLDVALIRAMNLQHGFWLAMTSIIVLQPYGSGTLRRSVQRVGGTIAGGVLAALLAAGIHSVGGIIAVITVTSVLTLATYAVDYAWYCFFLTPTFVLMSLPHLRDWHYAGVRMETTVIGALVAVLAMRVLWPEREQIEFGRLLGRGAAADAEYVRAMMRFWSVGADERMAAERTILAPARRSCGLAINDAEETLDRLMLEPRVGRGARWEEALTFVTYLRRLTRAVTTLAVVGGAGAVERMEAVAVRLERVGAALVNGKIVEPIEGDGARVAADSESVAEQQMRRMERQVGVMERAAAELIAGV